MSAFSISTCHSSLFPFQSEDIPGVGAESMQHPVIPAWGTVSLPQRPSSLLGSHLSLPAGTRDRIHPPGSFPIHQDQPDSSGAVPRLDGRAGDAWCQTRWYKTMETSEKSPVALTEGRVTLTILIQVRVCCSTTKEKRGTSTLLYYYIICNIFFFFWWLTRVGGE